MFRILNKSNRKPETQTLNFTAMTESQVQELLVSTIKSEEGVFGFEWQKSKENSTLHYFQSQYTKPHFQSESEFRIITHREMNYSAFTLSFNRSSCFPFSFNNHETIWTKLNKLEMQEETVFLQVLLQKQIDTWKLKYQQQYLDYISGIDQPTSIAPIRNLQIKLHEFIKTKEEWVGANAEIVGARTKLTQDGFNAAIRFIVYHEKSAKEIANQVLNIFNSHRYVNSFVLASTNRSDTMNQMVYRRFPVFYRENILSVNELLPYFCKKETASSLSETQPIHEEYEQPQNEGLFELLPKGDAMQFEEDNEIETRLNNVLTKINLTDQHIKIKKTQYGATSKTITIPLVKGMSLSAIESRKKDIQSEMAFKDLAIKQGDEAATATLSFPTDKRNIVYLGKLIDSREFETYSDENPLPFIVGMDALGTSINSCLTKIKHLIVAGTTGSGKSVFLNCLLLTIMLMKNPNQVQVWLFDPKLVELTMFKKYPHVQDIITENEKAHKILMALTVKMDERYKLFESKGYRTIQQYNKREKEPLPYILVVIDELADLILSVPEIEFPITRLAQKARAAGIHLILCTQRPDVKVLSGRIKSNVRSRVCFALSSTPDYRTVLDTKPPFILLGRGDGVYTFEGMLGMERVQSPIIDLDDDTTVDIIEKYAKRWSGEFKKETLKIQRVPDDLDKIKRVIAESGETRLHELQKLLGIKTARVQELMQTLVDEQWLNPPKTRAKGYELALTDEERQKYLEGLQ